MRLLLAFAFAVSSASFAVADEKPIEIPLNDIWAHRMPGTKDVNKLDPYESGKPNAASQINRLFIIRLDEDTPPGKCFVVKGEGKKALENAVQVLIHNEPRLKGVQKGTPASLVFYSHPARGYVHLDSVVREGHVITVNYKVVIHQEANVTTHFALIPLRDLPIGKYTVKPVQVPAKGNRVPMPDPEHTEQAVCDSCSFVVAQAR